MCCIVVKYLPKFGWIGAKNRDRNYETTIGITQSNRYETQRLYIDDKLSRWTEGINEYGISILSAAFSVKNDEKEGAKMVKGSHRDRQGYFSPDGRDIREALKFKTIKEAIDHLIKAELAGATFIFNQEQCFLLEGGFNVKKSKSTKENPREYFYHIKEIKKKDGHCVRTNHGIDLPNLGYQPNSDTDEGKKARKSSEERYKVVVTNITNVKEPRDLLKAMSDQPNKDTFMNPIRTGNPDKKDMVTTGQLLIVPKTRTLHYRPIESKIDFEYNKINHPEAKTFFEIISSRSLLTFLEYFKPPGDMI
jgi:hypothetical protein